MENNAALPSHSYQNHLYALEAEKQIISDITRELRAIKSFVTNKDIILALIHCIEQEKDALRNDIYRNALEQVVQRTPDDI